MEMLLTVLFGCLALAPLVFVIKHERRSATLRKKYNDELERFISGKPNQWEEVSEEMACHDGGA